MRCRRCGWFYHYWCWYLWFGELLVKLDLLIITLQRMQVLLLVLKIIIYELTTTANIIFVLLLFFHLLIGLENLSEVHFLEFNFSVYWCLASFTWSDVTWRKDGHRFYFVDKIDDRHWLYFLDWINGGHWLYIFEWIDDGHWFCFLDRIELLSVAFKWHPHSILSLYLSGLLSLIRLKLDFLFLETRLVQ